MKDKKRFRWAGRYDCAFQQAVLILLDQESFLFTRLDGFGSIDAVRQTQTKAQYN
ncbi:MAG: hypothetical protein ACON4O_07175 [Lentimonas sp.]